MAGLTPQGLEIKRLPEVLEDIVTSERMNMRQDVATEDNTILGQLNNIIAAPAAELWQVCQAVDDNFKPLKAEGNNLDDLVVLNGLSRDVAIASFTDSQRYYGANNTLIPTTVILENPSTLDRFSPVTPITLTTASCVSCKVKLNTVGTGFSYTLSVNGNNYSSTANTALQVFTDITAQITADSSATYTGTYDIVAEEYLIETSDSNPIAFTANTLFDVEEVSAYGLTRAATVGPTVATVGSVQTIVIGTSGLNSTRNERDYSEGRNEEDDETLRARFLATKQITGSATAKAIEDQVLSVPGVTSALVVENYTEFTDSSGRPPRSFETIAQGGTDLAVATAIWEKKPVSIKTYGNSVQLIEDHRNRSQPVSFTRPTSILLAARVTYSAYAEETLSPAAEAEMAPIVESYINGLTINNDVIPRRMLGPIYTAVPGIDFLSVEIQIISASGDTPVVASWTDSRLPINSTQFARTSTADIYFNPV